MDVFLATEGPTRTGISRNYTIADLWVDGSWSLPPARSDKQVMIQSFLSTIKLSDHEDILEWCPNDRLTTRFATGEIYNMLKGSEPQATWFKEIRFPSGIPRHMFFCWLVTLNRCPTKDRMIRWGL